MPELVALDINDAVREILMMIQGEIRQNNVKLETVLSESLEPAMGNRVQLQQVLLNLAMNAIEAMSAVKNRRILRTLSKMDEADAIVVSVTDTGPGFEESDIEHMFEAMVTTKPHGMGLSTSKSIVEAHGAAYGPPCFSRTAPASNLRFPPRHPFLRVISTIISTCFRGEQVTRAGAQYAKARNRN